MMKLDTTTLEIQRKGSHHMTMMTWESESNPWKLLQHLWCLHSALCLSLAFQFSFDDMIMCPCSIFCKHVSCGHDKRVIVAFTKFDSHLLAAFYIREHENLLSTENMRSKNSEYSFSFY
jgi:hypothetical protein